MSIGVSGPDGITADWRRRLHGYRTEGAGPGRQAAAIGLGVFVGCLPLYGLHLPICLALGWLLGLNRLKLYLAANISNPVLMPFLLLSELQTGAWLRSGQPHALTLDAVRAVNPWWFGADLAVGAIALALILGMGTAALTYAALGGGVRHPVFERLAGRAANRYVQGSLTGWEFANAKLQSNPVYRASLCGRMLPSGGTLVDIGCGQGLMLALLAEARAESHQAGVTSLPVFDKLVGIETRVGVARLARAALGGDADVVEADASTLSFPPCSAAVLFDVLHMMPPDEQARLVARVRSALSPGGVLLVREADPSSGWRFSLVRMANRIKAMATGAWRQPLCFRHPDNWAALFHQAGFDVQHRDQGDQGPFGNVLFVLTATEARS